MCIKRKVVSIRLFRPIPFEPPVSDSFPISPSSSMRSPSPMGDCYEHFFRWLSKKEGFNLPDTDIQADHARQHDKGSPSWLSTSFLDSVGVEEHKDGTVHHVAPLRGIGAVAATSTIRYQNIMNSDMPSAFGIRISGKNDSNNKRHSHIFGLDLSKSIPSMETGKNESISDPQFRNEETQSTRGSAGCGEKSTNNSQLMDVMISSHLDACRREWGASELKWQAVWYPKKAKPNAMNSFLSIFRPK